MNATRERRTSRPLSLCDPLADVFREHVHQDVAEVEHRIAELPEVDLRPSLVLVHGGFGPPALVSALYVRGVDVDDLPTRWKALENDRSSTERIVPLEMEGANGDVTG